jgi:hypothetical protein
MMQNSEQSDMNWCAVQKDMTLVVCMRNRESEIPGESEILLLMKSLVWKFNHNAWLLDLHLPSIPIHFGHLIVILIASLWVLGLHPSNLTQIVSRGTSQIRKKWKHMFSQCRICPLVQKYATFKLNNWKKVNIEIDQWYHFVDGVTRGLSINHLYSVLLDQ